jgi:hypothetical protein
MSCAHVTPSRSRSAGQGGPFACQGAFDKCREAEPRGGEPLRGASRRQPSVGPPLVRSAARERWVSTTPRTLAKPATTKGADIMDLAGVSRLFCEITSRIGPESRVWLGAGLACVLAVTALAVVYKAPTAAYVVLLVVALAVVAAGQSERVPMGSSGWAGPPRPTSAPRPSHRRPVAAHRSLPSSERSSGAARRESAQLTATVLLARWPPHRPSPLPYAASALASRHRTRGAARR